ncbi:penicillin-binding protein 2 [Paenibacillus sp. IB182496]|uniref:Penicillin-binding protein 2 n=1 Tax=Paenibacillus sabuli TaxID=2772509 RepID=A0A927BSC2_9BACL|nr:penicillin-binding protein 2 [Paenibacillus sabuli]MBD2844538.1 penicillin-binding protein 2 [Paenibacillus sabuli]
MEKAGDARRGKRIYRAGVALTLGLGLLVLRLAWLQWLPHLPAAADADHYRSASVRQREQVLELDSGRADFEDRSGRAWTGMTITALAAFPVTDRSHSMRPEVLERLADVLAADPDRLRVWLAQLREPAFWRANAKRPHALTQAQADGINKLGIEGVAAVPYRERYRDDHLAQHVLGYISQHPERLEADYSLELSRGSRHRNDLIGGAGLEKSLDSLIRGLGATRIHRYTDGGRRKSLHGPANRLDKPDNPYYPLKVRTTLDLGLQASLEKYIDQQGLREGAVVVLDAATGDIAAMLSRPSYDPAHIGAGGSDTRNHALAAAAPGSIFKLVTEAAALEAGVVEPDEHFTCNGEYGRYGLSCWKRGGHGVLTLEEGLAQSCNVVFATLGERLSARQLQSTADQLGLGRRIGWADPDGVGPLKARLRLLGEEEAGSVFSALPAQRDGGLLAQTAIGQRDVRLSPLQAANLMVTLLHDGRVSAPRIVTDIRYANGQRLARFPARTGSSAYGQISAKTARTLLRGMEAVVRSGTGRSIRTAWPAAGKSGTAETLVAGKPRVNQWFVGYGPALRPRYAVAVLAENRPPDSNHLATQLFAGVLERVAAQEGK